jgi:hypothetical protein
MGFQLIFRRPVWARRLLRIVVVFVAALLSVSWALGAGAADDRAVGVGADAPHADLAGSHLDHADVPADAPLLPIGAVQLPRIPDGFATRDVGWLHLAFPVGLDHWVEPLIEDANTFRAEVAARLGQPVLERVHVRLARDPAQMTGLAPVGAPYPKYAAGVAYSRLGLVLLTTEPVHSGDAHDLLTTFRHELAHVALYDALDSHRVPLWFNEGLAIHLSRENTFARTRSLWTASLSGNLIPLKDLSRRFPADVVGVPTAYAQSADIVRFLLRTGDEQRFQSLISRVRKAQPFDRALYDAYGMDDYNLEQAWKENVESRFSLWPALFSGTVIWTLGVVLVTLAWRRKRAKQRVTLARWAREEEVDEARALRLAQPEPPPPWMRDQGPSIPPGSRRDPNVPKVEHEGDWHTLH